MIPMEYIWYLCKCDKKKIVALLICKWVKKCCCMLILVQTSISSVVYGDGQSRICGGSDHCAWPEVAWPEVILSGSMFCAYATGSCPISALVGPFDRKWRQSRDRKRPCPVLSLTESMFCACPAFPAFFS